MDFDDDASNQDPQAILFLDCNNQASLSDEIADTDKYGPKALTKDEFLPWLAETSPTNPSMEAIALPPPCQGGQEAPEAESSYTDDLDLLFSADNKEEQLDTIDIGAEAGVCGLRNLGNTCFLSTGVQCLMATPALVQCLLQQSSAASTGPDSLTTQLSALSHKIWSGHYSTVSPSDFKETLGVRYSQFKDYRQHDCQEFLALLLDSLHEQMNCASLDNKLHDLSEMNCDTQRHINPLPSESLVNLSKEIPSANNNLKNTNNLKDKMDETNKYMLAASYVDAKMNNCAVSDTPKTVDSPKLPILVKCNGDNTCDSLVKNDQTLINSKTKDSSNDNIMNNYAQRLNGLQDILKDAKTSNVNVLVTNHIANNEIKFDSDKFPKIEKVRRRETFNLNSFHLYDNNMTNGKRGKSTVTHYNTTVDFREGLDLKRLKVQRKEDAETEAEQESMDCDWEKNYRMEDERKLRGSIKTLDKNYRMECERLGRDADPSAARETDTSAMRSVVVDREAEEHWQKHLAAHRSIIVDTFQGQFKSTVVCSTCKHVSVTYEPFMYLSVPLPHAMEIQLCITLVSGRELEPQQFLVTVNKQETLGNVKEQLMQLANRPLCSSLVLAEVLDCHISKILDDHYLVRLINYTSRSLYAFEVANFSCFAGLPDSNDGDKGCDDVVDLTGDSCTICLEEKDSDMSRHVGCTCILCDSCIARSTQHYGGEALKCPVCRQDLVVGENLVPVSITDNKPPLRMVNVSLVYRLDTVGDGSNNTRTVELFGHPRLLRLPNSLPSQQLHEAVASLVPYSAPYKILLVDGKGHHCSRCMFNAHCRGCPVTLEGCLTLRTGDGLAAMFMEPVTELTMVQPSSLQAPAYKSLTLYDCLQAFSQSDTLDEQNPWYCPNCKKNQCATKTLSVWRYPNYLIIYLKRFVFQDCVSLKLDDKVIFPLKGLDLSPNGVLYDLYACVCHVGGTSAGHYTAYTQHPRSGEWHHFNDDRVSSKPPQEDDFSNAYILFYKIRGPDTKNEDFNAKLVPHNGGSLS